jgi:hypothetical protein
VHAQLSYLTADPAALDKVVTWAERGREVHAGAPGSLGLTLTGDRERGTVLLVWFWVSGDAMREYEKDLAPWREQALGAGAATLTVERYRIGSHAVPQRPTEGAGARVLRVQTDPDRIEAVVQAYEDVELPWLLEADGFCTSVLLLDPGTGQGCQQTVWRDADALAASRGRAAVARADAVAAAAMSVLSLEEHRLLLTTATLPRHDVAVG